MESQCDTFLRLLTVDQVASRLSVTPKRGYEMISLGILPAEIVVRLGRQIRVQEPGLTRWVLAGGRQA